MNSERSDDFKSLPDARRRKLLDWIKKKVSPSSFQLVYCSMLVTKFNKANRDDVTMKQMKGAMLESLYEPTNPGAYDWVFGGDLKD